MALAFLKYKGGNDSHQEFEADIGDNRFFRIYIGDHHTHRSYGVPILERRSFVSHIYGPIPEFKMGRIRFRIPDSLFSRENAYVQIVSYREKNEVGPAISPVERVFPGIGSRELPGIQLSIESSNMNKEIKSIPFQYKESGVSQAMFLDQVFKFLPKVLPAVGSLVGGAIGGGGNRSSSGGGGSSSGGGGDLKGQIMQLLSDPEKLQKVIDLFKALAPNAQGATTTPQQSTAASASLSSSKSRLSNAFIEPMTIMAIVGTVIDGLEKLGKVGAQINKDELDALQNLNPGVDDPDVQGLLNQMSVYDYSTANAMDPTMIMKLVGTITDGLEKLGKIGAQINKDELDALQNLNPGVDDADVQGLLNAMGASTSYFKRIRFKRSSIVKMQIGDINLSPVGEKQRYLYASGNNIVVPILLDTPRDIPRGGFQIIARNKATGEFAFEVRQGHRGSKGGLFEKNPTISPEDYATLVPGEEYELEIAVLWRGKNRKIFGVSLQVPIAIAHEYVFERLGAKQRVVALNDIEQHRPFWHKVWQADYSDETVRYEFECKYYFAIEADRKSNAQMQTVEYLTPARPRKMEGKMKSGLVLSPEVLNDLLPTIGAKRLTEGQIKALKAPSFIDTQHRASRTGLKYRGKSGGAAALWVYPEMALREVVLKKVGRVTPYGTVEELTEETVLFPVPESAHFIGVESEGLL